MNTVSRILLTLGLSLTLVACGGSGGGGDSDTSSQQTAPAPSAPAAPSPGDSQDSGAPSSPSSPATPEPPSGSAFSQDVQLSWTAPDARENGEPLMLSEIKGYQIYYIHENDMENAGSGSSVWIEGGSTSNATVTVSAPGTYYFAIAAVDQDDLTSSLSNHVSINVN